MTHDTDKMNRQNGVAPCHDNPEDKWLKKFASTSKGRLPLISLWCLAVFVCAGSRVTAVPPELQVLHLLRCYALGIIPTGEHDMR